MKTKSKLLVLIVVLCVVVVVAALGIMSYVNAQSAEQGAQTLRESILDAAVQCYAIEGQYPPSVDYLKDNYGITINDDTYTVYYEVFAPNVAPTVEVVVSE